MSFICLILMFVLVHYSWRYIQIDVYLNIPKELKSINSISKDDLLQQQRLAILSKKLLIDSLTNLALLMIWFSPFIILYFTLGKNYTYLMMSSSSFWFVSLFLAILYYRSIKSNE
jgi:hypothetical protein